MEYYFKHKVQKINSFNRFCVRESAYFVAGNFTLYISEASEMLLDEITKPAFALNLNGQSKKALRIL